MIVIPQTFADEIMTFFSNVDYILQDVVPKNRQGSDLLFELINDTFNLLNKENSTAIRDEIVLALNLDQEKRNQNSKDAYDLLYKEIKFFNTRYDYVSVYTPLTILPDLNLPTFLVEIPSKEKIENSNTVLKSIKDLFDKLPKWLKKILTVLGEILGIAKTLIGN